MGEKKGSFLDGVEKAWNGLTETYNNASGWGKGGLIALGVVGGVVGGTAALRMTGHVLRYATGTIGGLAAIAAVGGVALHALGVVDLRNAFNSVADNFFDGQPLLRTENQLSSLIEKGEIADSNTLQSIVDKANSANEESQKALNVTELKGDMNSTLDQLHKAMENPAERKTFLENYTGFYSKWGNGLTGHGFLTPEQMVDRLNKDWDPDQEGTQVSLYVKNGNNEYVRKEEFVNQTEKVEPPTASASLNNA